MKKILGVLVLSFLLSTSVLSAGKCIKGNCKNGYGTYDFSNGKKYVGNFVNGQFEGKGIFTWPPGGKTIKYEGDFRYSKLDGKGTLEFYSNKNGIKEKIIYIGEFFNNKRHGKGLVKNITRKTVATGIWENGKFIKLVIDNENLTNLKTNLIKIPLTIHIIKISKDDFITTTTEKVVKNDLKINNKIWKQLGVKWDLKKINYIKAKTNKLSKDIEFININCDKNSLCKNVKYSKKRDKIYKKIIQYNSTHNKKTVNVYYLPKMFTKNQCGMTWAPSKNRDGFVVLGEKCPLTKSSTTLAHELGHMLGLKHVNDQTNLMYGSGTVQVNLYSNQHSQIKNFYNDILLKKLRGF